MTERTPHVYSVGALYHPSRRRWPDDVAQYQYRAGQHELVLFWRSPSRREIDEVRRGSAAFALFHRADQIVLCFRFGALQWMDAPYTWHRVDAAEQTLPEAVLAGDESRALLHVILVDSTTGVIRALCASSWSPAFTVAVHLAIRDQAARPFDPGRYDAEIGRLYRTYPDSSRLAAACTVRCESGREA